MKRYSIVIVVHKRDVKVAKQNIPLIYRMIKPGKIIIISHEDVRNEILGMHLDYVRFMDENAVVPYLNFTAVKRAMLERTVFAERTGWYFQQFLKMAYAYICEDEWYLLWDADTIPLRNISFMSGRSKGILDVKTEYHRPYFWTLEKILGIKKCIRESFIAEHMLINRKVMLDLIGRIEGNQNLQGQYFFEKIIHSVRAVDLRDSGFSEFETYGNFVMQYYPQMYTLRRLKTLREAKILLGDHVDGKILAWAGKSYDMISLEKYQNVNAVCHWCVNSFLRHFVSMKAMWEMYKIVHAGNYRE